MQTAVDATAESAFFKRLPIELRRQIYIAAFGGRVIHMDLRFGYPELPVPRHGRTTGNGVYPRDRFAQPDWMWWSSVCHRDPMDEGYKDRCHTGSGDTQCDLWPGEIPDKCFLGVMGWLLSCRRA